MADPERAHEPSMEEILASIRRIISDDTEAEAANDGPAPEPDTVEEEDETAAEAIADDQFTRAFEPAEVDSDDESEAEAEAELPEPAEAPEESEAEDEPFELPDPPAPEVQDEDDEEDNDDDAGEVLELTEVVEEDDADDLEAYRPAEIAFAEAEADDPEPAIAERPAEGLLSQAAEAEATAALGALASSLRSHSGTPRTLEQIAEDLLRPMLKAWLDENLPPLVERLVREEIERLARRAK